MGTTKSVWQANTERLAKEIAAAAREAHTEEDLKMRVEPLLQRTFREVGIDVDVAYEKATKLTAKRMDAVYGHLIIEYKAPRKLAAAPSRAAVVRRLETYLREEAARHGDPDAFLEKAVGVALDGANLLFVRYSRHARILPTPVPTGVGQRDMFPEIAPRQGFQVQGPFPVSEQSLANLLIYVRSAARRPLVAEHVADVFGPQNDVARIAVSELYAAAMRGQRRAARGRVATFYDEWDRIFGAVYGERLDKADAAADETARSYGLPSGVRLKTLLFAIHSYYALLMKLMAHELLALQQGFGVESFVEGLAAADDDALRKRLDYLEDGSDFNRLGIVNFLEADFFSWYLDAWTRPVAGAVRGMIRALAEFEPATPILAPDWTRDLLQKLYELIVPRNLRHGLGEYYTPDWLAGYLVDRSGYAGDPSTRFLDPACGSGTFLVQAIQRVVDRATGQSRARMAEIGRAILEGVVGFDLNPLAVLAARTNYLIAFAKFLPHVRPISLPVYLCDSVVPLERPCERAGANARLFPDDTVVFRTREHDYVFPLSMKTRERIDRFCAVVLTALRGKLPPAKFRKQLAREVADLTDEEAARLEAIYAHIKQLDDDDRDGIWAHYIKNAFAPTYVGKFDYVVGNPPWIRWGCLSSEYRERTVGLWHGYGLFSLKGHQTRLGAGEKDFSMLFVYACADRYLKDGGTLAFVITQEVFKSKGAGEGFRRFRVGDSGASLRVLWMEDMVNLQPFQAANKTSIFALRKGEATKYPLPVVEWRRKRGVGRIPPEWTLAQVQAAADRERMQAVPVDPGRPVSSWQTASAAELKELGALKGTNPYRAFLGARVEPYGVFWLDVLDVRPDGLIVVENQHDRGKREVRKVRDAIEADLVFPAVSGGDLVRYGTRSHVHVLISQNPATRAPYPRDWMAERAPLTLGYLQQFKDVLLSRGSRAVREFAEQTEFYAMYGIGEYTFARYRVAWKRMASSMSATVLSNVRTPYGSKPVVSTDTTSFIVAGSRLEAHYLCAVLNSDLADAYIRSFSSGGRGFGAPSVVQNLAIPSFQEGEQTHRRLTELSEGAHRRVERSEAIEDIDEEVNRTVRALWNIAS
ncbi:MAG: N-6 DNA methylase [Myxococcota bacterium]|nr:N-6 DNA methylase [Myxococcota bacterium]